MFGMSELTLEVINWKSTFTMNDNTADILCNIAKMYKEAIGLDLQRLKLNNHNSGFLIKLLACSKLAQIGMFVRQSFYFSAK